MKPTPHGNDAAQPKIARRRADAQSDGASSSPQTSGAPSGAQDTLGNAVLRSALAGADDGGVGPVLRSQVMLAAAGVPAPDGGNSSIQRAMSGGGIALPSPLQSKMEGAFGHELDHVRIHVGTAAADAAQAIAAEAFTVGSHLFFGPGMYQPGSSRGEQLIAHELTHVIQGDQGRLTGSGVSSPTDATEREAYRNEQLYRNADGLYGDGGSSRRAPTSKSVNARISRSADEKAAAPTPEAPVQGPAGPQPTETGPTPAPTAPGFAPTDAGALPAVTASNAAQNPAGPVNPATPTVARADTSATGDGTGQVGALPQAVPTASTFATPTVGGMSPALGGGGAAMSGPTTGGDFVEQIRAAAEQQKSAVTTKAQSVKDQVGTALEAERKRISDGFDQLLQRLQTAKDAALQDVQTRSEAAKTRVRNAATTERSNLEAALSRQQTAARQAGESAAQEAIRAATAEGDRVTQGCSQRAQRARDIASSWAGRFASLEGGGDTASKVRQQGDRLAQELQNGATEGRQVCIEHGNKAASDIRKDAEDVANGMTDKVQESRDRIDKDRDDALTAIDDGLTAARDGISQSFEQTKSEIEGKRTEATQGFDQLKDGAVAQVDAALQQVTTKLDEIVTQMTTDVQSMVDGAVEVAFAPEVSAEIDAGISRTVTEYVTKLGEFGTQATAGFDQVLTDATTAATQQVDGVVQQLDTVASGYEQNVRGKVDQTVAKADESADSAVQDMQKVTPLVEAELQKGVAKGQEEWRKQITEKIGGTLHGRIDEVFSKQDSALSKLDGELGKQYEDARRKIEDAKSRSEGGFWSQAWGVVKDAGSAVGSAIGSAFEFVGGMVVGFFEAAWELLKGLWKLLSTPLGWLMLAIAVILVVIVVVLFGWEALIIAGLIMGIAMAAYYIYLAVTTPGLSAYERGKLFGHATFELVMGFAGVEFKGGSLMRFTQWGGKIPQAVSIVQKAGSVGKAAEIYRLVGSLDRTLSLIDKVGDVGRVAELVGRVGDAGQLISLIDKVGDVGRLTSLLDKVGDAGRLTSLLDKVGDVGQLGSLIDKVGDAGRLSSLIDRVGSAERLTTLLDRVGNADQLAGLLDKVGDAERLSTLIDKVGDVNQLSALIDRVGNAERLGTLIDKVGDVNQLTTLLDRVGDAERLTALIDKVGDVERLTSLLDKVGDAERLGALIDKVGDVDKLTALIDKVGNVDTLAALIDRVGNVDTLAALIDKVGDVDRLGSLIDRVGDVDRLVGLLDKAGSADQLVALLDKVGDAERLAALIDRAGSGERLSSLLDKVGDVGKLDDLLTRAGSADTLEALLAKCPDAEQLARILADGNDPKLALKILEGGATPEETLARLAKVQDDAARVAELEKSGDLANSTFHGSNSDMLPGLEQTGGKIKPAKQLQDEGLMPKTGEGDLFSGSTGPKDFISVGQGEAGMGTSMAYAEANQVLSHYNPQLLKVEELQSEIARLRNMVDHYDDMGFLTNHIPKPKLTERLAQLEREMQLREAFPHDHPRYLGGPGNESNYPILFEFNGGGLRTAVRGDVRPGGMLGGEASVYDQIDLANRLVRVFVPEAHRAEAAAQLERILGHNNFEVLSLEGAKAGLSTGGDAATTGDATLNGLRGLQESIEQMFAFGNQMIGSRQVEALAADLGVEVSRLPPALTKVGGDANVLRSLVQKAGGNLDSVEALLNRVPDPNQLGRLLDKAGDASKLDELLTEAKDPNQLLKWLEAGEKPDEILARLRKPPEPPSGGGGGGGGDGGGGGGGGGGDGGGVGPTGPSRPPRPGSLENPISVSDKVVARGERVFHLNRKAIKNGEKIVGQPEAANAGDAAREAVAAELAAGRSNVDRVVMGAEADELINGSRGLEMSCDVVAITKDGKYVLYEAKGTDVVHGLEQLEHSATMLGRERVTRYNLVMADRIKTPGYSVDGLGQLLVNGSVYKINGKPVFVTFAK